MHSVGSAQVKLFLSSHVLFVTQTFEGARSFWEPSFLFEAGKLAPYFFLFLVLAVRWNRPTPLFILSLWILASYLLKCCLSVVVTTLQAYKKDCPGRNPAAVVKRWAETRPRIRADVESQTFRNETDFGHRCRLHCVHRLRRPTLTRTRTS